ncbi:hypothetical protein A1O3_03619 [Capronia epimyces CBS 606.96]|uniref:NTF2-like domain-containing protein n=1 Tax=Capronia epimyces CBS 606.96 TaxID=1182542 RepID=W9YBM4_9EURO|nr:uncharacterized protein A1O3_03619 [Capronia epimyces CBS 606.96]EXJ86666.1 hypothetical protein A1O3_03619 [Capronia epimyces CBS 606.96]
MRISILSATLAMTMTVMVSVLAHPWTDWPGQQTCLNDTGVAYLVQGYTYLLEQPGGPDFNSTANTILSDQFFVCSDSINSLSGRPLGQLAYPNKQAFIASQFVTPPLPTVSTLATFHNCQSVAWRWNASGIGANQYEIKGLINFDVNPTTLQIDAVYSEFNTAAFQADLGNPECQQK